MVPAHPVWDPCRRAAPRTGPRSSRPALRWCAAPAPACHRRMAWLARMPLLEPMVGRGHDPVRRQRDDVGAEVDVGGDQPGRQRGQAADVGRAEAGPARVRRLRPASSRALADRLKAATAAHRRPHRASPGSAARPPRAAPPGPTARPCPPSPRRPYGERHGGEPAGVGHELDLPAPQQGRQHDERRGQPGADVRPPPPERDLRGGAGEHERRRPPTPARAGWRRARGCSWSPSRGRARCG